MIFALMMIALVAAIAYFHYVQGFFSATLSAMAAVLAAVLALGYQEVVVQSLLKGRMADYANGTVTIAIFAGVYFVLRLALDNAIPGNVRVPVIVDRIGAAVMGIIAGIFTTGILSVAAQALPFGPSIAMYSRYEIADRRVIIPNTRSGQQSLDREVFDELVADSFDTAKPQSMLLPVDDVVLGFLIKTSNAAMRGAVPFDQMNPNYLQQLFGQRIAVEIGARQTAMNGVVEQVKLAGMYQVDSVNQIEGELSTLRVNRDLKSELKPKEDQLLVVARVTFTDKSSDQRDRLARVAPSAVRLCVGGKNYYPVGTLEGNLMFATRADDKLFLDVAGADQSADFVFVVDLADAFVSRPIDAKTNELEFAAGAFLEVKRLARFALAGKSIGNAPPDEGTVAVLRKPMIVTQHRDSVESDAASRAGFVVNKVEQSSALFVEIGIGDADPNAPLVDVAGGKLTLRDRAISRLALTTATTLKELRGEGAFVTQLWQPQGRKLVQVVGTPPAKTNNPWAWADRLLTFEIVDQDGVGYKPNGVLVKIKRGETDQLLGAYVADNILNAVPKRDEGRPTEVYMLFLVPQGKTITQVRAGGVSIKALNLNLN